MVYLLVLLAQLCYVQAGRIPTFAGPYIAYVDRIYMCEGPLHDWTWNLKVSHFNPARPTEIQRVTGWINATAQNMTDKCYIHIFLDTRSNNMWKENAFVFKFPTDACSALRKHMPEAFYRLFQQDRKDKKNACQVSTKLYEHLNVPVPWTFPTIPVMPYGFYRFRLMSGYKELPRPEACFVADVGVIPKPN